jgi:hypothetical protein
MRQKNEKSETKYFFRKIENIFFTKMKKNLKKKGCNSFRNEHPKKTNQSNNTFSFPGELYKIISPIKKDEVLVKAEPEVKGVILVEGEGILIGIKGLELLIKGVEGVGGAGRARGAEGIELVDTSSTSKEEFKF